MDVTEVEAPSSPDDDRLWAVAHPREILFLTPAGTTGDQDLRRQVAPMSADLVVEYRVRDSDEAVLQALTSVDDPRTLVVTLARRAIQQQCAQTTAQELISTDRAAFANSIANAIQKDLDRLQTGLVVTGIDAEAIHPPVEAANSFITAQTAELEAKAAIDLARANAAILLAMAGQDAAEIRNKAQAAALETVAAARVETFESQALTRARSSRAEPIDLELAVEAFTEAWANRPLTVIDHRLEAPAGHRIQLEDLRQ
jgi:membrane protease subunit HflK